MTYCWIPHPFDCLPVFILPADLRSGFFAKVFGEKDGVIGGSYVLSYGRKLDLTMDIINDQALSSFDLRVHRDGGELGFRAVLESNGLLFMTGGHPDDQVNGPIMKDVISVFRRTLGHVDMRHQRGMDGFNSSDETGREEALSELMEGMVGVLRDELWHFSSDVHQCLEIQKVQASNTVDMSVSDLRMSLENRFRDVRSSNSDELNTHRLDIHIEDMYSESRQHLRVVRNFSRLFGFSTHQRAIDEFESYSDMMYENTVRYRGLISKAYGFRTDMIHMEAAEVSLELSKNTEILSQRMLFLTSWAIWVALVQLSRDLFIGDMSAVGFTLASLTPLMLVPLKRLVEYRRSESE